MKKAVYAGSFDPPTNGHAWMIEQGACLFDSLVVAVGVNPAKKALFTLDEREAMVRAVARRFRNVKVTTFERRYLARYARSIGASYNLRGVRTVADYEYERTMRYVNSDLNPALRTVFLIPPREVAEISSSFVKGLVGFEGWRGVVKRYVPPPVYGLLVKKYGNE